MAYRLVLRSVGLMRPLVSKLCCSFLSLLTVVIDAIPPLCAYVDTSRQLVLSKLRASVALVWLTACQDAARRPSDAMEQFVGALVEITQWRSPRT